MSRYISRLAAGYARWLLPLAIAIPLVLNGLLCNTSAMKQEEVALYCLMNSVAEIGLFATAIGWLARSLNQVDKSRHQAEQELQRMNQALEQQVEVRTAELVQSQQQHQTLVNSVDGIVWEADPQMLQFTFVSQQVERILGYPIADWYEPGFWMNHLHPDDREETVAVCLATTQSRQDHQFEYRMVAANGEFVWFHNLVKVEVKDNQVVNLVGLLIDISERKRSEAERHQAEVALRQSESKYRALVEALPDLIMRMSGDGAYLDFFPAKTFPVLGGDVLIGQTIYERSLPVDLAELRMGYIQQVLQTGEMQVYEQQILVEGELRTEEVRIAISGDHEVVVIVRDTTARKQAEAALVESEAKFRSLVENATDIIYTRNLDGTLTYVSPQVTQILGYDVLELLGQKVWEIVHPDDVAIAQSEVQRMIETGESQINREEQVRRKDGSWCWITVNFSLIRDADGQVTGIQGMARDISERKRLEADRKAAEAALWESRQLLQRILDSVPQAIFWKDCNSVYLGCNQRFTRDVNLLSTDQVIGKTDFDLPWTQKEADWYRECDRRVMDANTPMLRILETQQQGNGQQIWIETSKVPLHDANGDVIGILGTSEDITECKQAELALQYQAQQEQALNRVVQMIRNSLELETIFSTAVQEAAQLVDVNRAYVLEYQSSGDYWVFIAEYSGDPAARSMIGYQIPDANNPISDQLRRFEIVQINDTSQMDQADSVNPIVAQAVPGAWLIAPLIVNGAVWGSFSFIKHQPSLFQDEQVALARRLADQLAIAIQQSILYEQLQQLNANLEQQVQERTAQLKQSLDFEATLKRITDAVRDSLDENRILQTVVEEVAQQVGVHLCNIVMYNDGESPEQLNPATFTVNSEYTLIPNLSGSILDPEDFSTVYDQLLRGITTQFCTILPQSPDTCSTLLLSPIMDEQGAIGDLLLLRDEQTVFNQSEIRLVEQVANQCAIALRQSQLYQSAQAQVIELERLNHLKDDFLSTVSHELRTPMSNIKMATQMLEVTLSRLDVLDTQATVTRYFKILKEEGQREVNLINNLLDLSRLDADTEPLSLSMVALQDWLPHLADPFIERVHRQNQQFQLDISKDLPALTTDLVYLERVLTELLNNACKYTASGETITVSANVIEKRIENSELRIQTAEYSHFAIPFGSTQGERTSQFPYFQITVSNTGVEIPSSECDRIFEKFYRIPNNDPWKHGGTGLGLALSKKLIEKLGGTIDIVSCQKRTSFIIYLPLHPNEVGDW